MSSRAIFGSEGTSRRTLPSGQSVVPAIPGEGRLSRKKAQSATWDGRFWREERADRRSGREKESRPNWRAFLPGVVANCRFSAASNPVTDTLLVALSFGTAFAFVDRLKTAFAWNFLVPSPGSALSDLKWGLVPVLAGLVSLLNYSEGLYGGMGGEPRQERNRLAKSVAWSLLLTSAALLLSSANRLVMGAAVATGSLLAYCALWFWRAWQWRKTAQRRANGQGKRNVLIVGAGTLGRELATALSRDFGGERTFVGFLDANAAVGSEIRGRPEDLTAIARSHFVDEVILATPDQPELAERVTREARRCRLDIRTVAPLPCQPGYREAEHLGRLPLLTVHEEPVPVLGPSLKRAFDVLSSLASLFVTAPLFAAIAVAIKLDSSGPVFYRAPRAGRKGRTFPCFKFRTMIAHADTLKEALRERNERCGPFFKISDDPRITRLGRLLRRYSLDELPQLWNVLRGEMSMVGPRPHPLDDCQHYQLEYLRRLDVRPGITGLWQVTARHDSSFQRGLMLDLQYIEHWDFWSDLRILGRTGTAVWKGSGK